MKIENKSRVGKGEFDFVDFQFTPKPLAEPYLNLSIHTALHDKDTAQG